jgi:aldehyde dehydrogenase (NAD+)
MQLMAAGCTVIQKPAEISPFSAYIVTQIFHDAGIPSGVFNLVPGKGDLVGDAISKHKSIDLVSFTGSTKAGRAVAKGAAETSKKVILELGGKSACIALIDADIKSTVKAAIASVFNNNGQMCGAWTRMLVPASQLKEYEKLLVAAAKDLKVGRPDDPASDNGPLASKQQYETVTRYIELGIEEGARLACGGLQRPGELKTGYYVLPTIFTDVKNGMRIAQEEIFGPVLCVIPYENEQEAIEIANDSVYGLRGAVFSSDEEHAKRVAKRIRTGQVDLNGYKMRTYSPFGGYKLSGYGRCQGRYGFEEFLQIKSIQL